MIGIPDDRLGQKVVLCVVVKDGHTTTPEDISAFLKERIASYKVPKEIIFFADGEIPMTGSDTKVRDLELLSLVQDRLSTNGAKL